MEERVNELAAWQDRIDDFFQGKLSDAETAQLMAQLKEAKVYEAFLVEQQAQEAVVSYERKSLKKLLQNEESKLKPLDGARSKISIRLLLKVAACFLLVAIVYVFWPSSKEQDLFTKYYKPYPNVVAPIAKSSSPDDQLVIAIQTYERSDYVRADSLFQLIPNGIIKYFYHGLVHIELGNMETARVLLDQVLESEVSEFTEPAKWYYALTYLTTEENSKVIEWLSTIDTNVLYYTDVQDLRNSLTN